MDKPGYTPGPWIVKRNGPMVWVESPVHTVCSFYRENVGYAPSVSMDSEANARLIAAAPDLIEALDGPDPDAPECIRPLSWLHSMIAHCKARGPAPDDDDPAAFHDMIGEVEAMYVRARAALSKATGGSHEQG